MNKETIQERKAIQGYEGESGHESRRGQSHYRDADRVHCYGAAPVADAPISVEQEDKSMILPIPMLLDADPGTTYPVLSLSLI